MAKKRIPVQIEESLWQWCADQANSYGMSISAFINMTIMQFKQNTEALGAMKDMTTIYDKLAEIEASISNSKRQ